jgi:hypothetical protein
MVVSITSIQSPLHFFLNQISIRHHDSAKDLSSLFLSRLSLRSDDGTGPSLFTSRPISLLAGSAYALKAVSRPKVSFWPDGSVREITHDCVLYVCVP